MAGQEVGDEHLLGETQDDQLDGARDLQVLRVGRARELWQKRRRAQDGAGDQLGEEGDVQERIERADGALDLAAVGVDHQRDGVEDEERDSHGQRELRQVARREPRAEGVQDHEGGAGGESGVLEDRERQERQRGAGRQDSFAVGSALQPLQRAAHAKGEQRDADEQGEEADVPVRVERIAGGQQERLVGSGAGAQGPGDRERSEEEERVVRGGKQHARAPAPAREAARSAPFDLRPPPAGEGRRARGPPQIPEVGEPACAREGSFAIASPSRPEAGQ